MCLNVAYQYFRKIRLKHLTTICGDIILFYPIAK